MRWRQAVQAGPSSPKPLAVSAGWLPRRKVDITDGELVRLWAARCAQWARLLEDLRVAHARDFGRTPGPLHWTLGTTLGPWSWFGFYWEPERYWFGYGFDEVEWRPLIEADHRVPGSRQVWLQMEHQIPSQWQLQKFANYSRLWGPAVVEVDLQSHRDWFTQRSQELHEYAVVER